MDPKETSSVMTVGGADDQRESTDSTSFSVPSLELSDGLTAAGNSLDVDDGLSSPYSAVGPEGYSLSTEVPSLREEEAPEALGEMFSDGFSQSGSLCSGLQ